MRLLVAVLICCVVSTTVRADYDSGVLAYESGRYDIALEEFNLFSERGDPRAQFMLGAMYFHGKGVPQIFGLNPASTTHMRLNALLYEKSFNFHWLWSTHATSWPLTSRRACAPMRPDLMSVDVGMITDLTAQIDIANQSSDVARKRSFKV